MGKKKFLAGILVVLLLAVFSVTLVACKEKISPIVTPDVPTGTVEAPSSGDLLLVMLKGMGTEDNYVSMDFESTIDTNKAGPTGSDWDHRKFYLKGNFYLPQEGEKVGEFELGLGVIACNADGTESSDTSTNVELFMKNGRFYLSVGEMSLYLEDIDFRWVAEQIQKLGSLQNVIDKIFDMIDGLEISGEINELVNLVSMLIFEIDTKATTYDATSKTGHIALKLAPDTLIDTIKGLIADVSIDDLLTSVGMQIQFPDGNGGMKPFSLDDFLAGLAFPDIDVIIAADVTNGKLNMDKLEDGSYGLQLHVTDVDGEYFHMSTSAEFKNTKIDIIPENINTYVPFGLLKLQLNTEFNLDAKSVDAGKLINFFAPNTLPENSLILDASLGLTVKVDADIRLKQEPNSENPNQLDDKSLLLIEVYSKRSTDPLIGLYLKDTKLYINLDNLLQMQGGNIDIRPGNIVVSGVTISKWLTEAIGLGTDMIGDLIDGIFAKEPETQPASVGAVAYSNGVQFKDGYSIKDIVFTANHDESGKSYISPTIGTILDVVRYTIGFEDFFTYDKDAGNINITVNNEFFKHLCEQFNLDIPELSNMKYFGEVNIGIDVDDNGLKDVYLDLALFPALAMLNGRLEFNNLHYGFGHRDELLANIDKATKEKEYIGNVKDFIFSAMDDLDIEFEASLAIAKGKYNASNIFGIETGLPEVEIDVSQDFILNLVLKIQVQMDEVTYKKDGKDVTEKIITRAFIGIINVKSNPIFPKDNMTVGIYYIDDRYADNNEFNNIVGSKSTDTHGTLYLDMSEFNMVGIGLPSFAISIDLNDALNGLLDSIAKKVEETLKWNLDFNIPEFSIPDLLPKSYSANTFASNVATNSTSDTDDSAFLYTLFNSENAERVDRILKISVTKELIERILELAQVNIGNITLPEIKLDATIDYIEGISLVIGAKHDAEVVDLSLKINKFKVGSTTEVDITKIVDRVKVDKDAYGLPISLDSLSSTDGIMALLPGVVNRLLDDVDMQFKLKISLQKGKYNIANILKSLGLDINLPIDIPEIDIAEDFVLDFDILIQLQSEIVDKVGVDGNVIEGEKEQIISRAMITLQSNSANPLFPKENGAIRIMYFDDRGTENGGLGLTKYSSTKADGKDENDKDVWVVNKTHGTLFLNLSNFQLLNFELPDVAIDIDLTQTINGILEGLFKKDDNSNNDNNTTYNIRDNQYGLVADGVDDMPAPNYLEVAVTSKVIAELLKMINPELEITLPDLLGNIKVDSETGFEVNIQTNITEKDISAMVNLRKLKLGAHLVASDFNLGDFNVADYGVPAGLEMKSLLKAVISKAFDDADIKLNMSVHMQAGTYDISNLLGMNTGLPSIPVVIDQDFDLDLILRVQIQSEIVDKTDKLGNKIDGKEQIISSAVISIENTGENPLLPAGSAIRLMYFDDRGSVANVPGLKKYNATKADGKDENGNDVYVVNKTHGTLLLNLSDFKLLNFRLPDVAIDINLTETLDSAMNSMFDNMLNGGNTNSVSVASDNASMLGALVGTVADGDATDDSTASAIQIAITTELVNQILKLVGLDFELTAQIEGGITLDKLNEFYIEINTADGEGENAKDIRVHIGLNYFKLGTHLDSVALPSGLDASKYGVAAELELPSLIKAIVNRALDDVDIKMNMRIHLDAGTYNASYILGIDTGLPSIPIVVEEGFDLDLTLSIQLQSETVAKRDVSGKVIDGEEQIISRAVISIVNNGDNPLLPAGSAIKLMYFDDRGSDNSGLGLKPYSATKADGKDDNGNDIYTINKSHGTLFLNLSKFNLLGLVLPDVAVDVDLTDLVGGAIDNLIESLTKKPGEGETEGDKTETEGGEATVSELFGAVADENGKASTIQIAITNELVNELLKLLGLNLNFTLPELEGGIKFEELGEFSVDIGTYDGEEENRKNISAHIGLNYFRLGTELKASDFDLTGFNAENYGVPSELELKALLKTVINRVLDDAEIKFHMGLHIDAGTYDVSNILGIDTGLPSVPVVVEKGFDLKLQFTIQLQSEIVDKVGVDGKVIEGEKEQIISRAVISIVNTGDNPFLPAGSAIRLMYFDDRGTGNDTLGLTKYSATKANGKDDQGNDVWVVNKTHGTLLLNLSDFKLLKLSLPDVAVDIDLTSILDGAIDSLLDSLIKKPDDNKPSEGGSTEGGNTDTASVVSELFGMVADGDNAEGKATGLQIKITTDLVNELLSMLGVHLGFSLPELDGGINLDEVNRFEIKVTAYDDGREFIVQIGLDSFKLGVNLNNSDLEIPADLNVGSYGVPTPLDLKSLLQAVINKALDDVEIKANLQIKLEAGTYDASNILGINTGLPSIPIIVEKDFVLDLDLLIQLQSEVVDKLGVDGKPVVDAQGNPTGEKEQIISGIMISITNNVSNPFLKAGDAIRIMYFDDRGSANQDMGLTKYSASITGQDDEGNDVWIVNKSHGTLLLNLSDFSFLNLQLPDISADIDLTALVDNVIGKIIDGLTKPNPPEEGEGSGEVTDTPSTVSELFGLVAEGDTEPATATSLEIQITVELVNELLRMIGANLDITLPEISGGILIDEIKGFEINIGTYDGEGDTRKEISAHVGLSKFALGTNVEEIKLPSNFDITNFGAPADLNLKSLLQAVINRALNDVDIKMGMAIHLDKGVYDISNILGIETGLPSIPVTSANGLDLDIELSAQIQSEIVAKTDMLGNEIGGTEQIISRAMITLTNKVANPFIPAGAAIRIMYFDDRGSANAGMDLTPYDAVVSGQDEEGKDVYTINKSHGTLLLNLSGFSFLNLTLPDVAVDIDLNKIVNNALAGIIDKLPDMGFGINVNSETSTVSEMFGLVADETENGTASSIEIAITSALVSEILKMVGVNLEFTLPELEGGIKVDEIRGFEVNIKTQDDDRVISAHIGLNHFKLGAKNVEITLPTGFDIKNFGEPSTLQLNDILKTVIYKALDDVDLKFNLSFAIAKGTYDVGKILGMFGLDFGGAGIPIDVSEGFNLDLSLRIQMKWFDFESDSDRTSGITRAKITLENKEANMFFNQAGEVLTAYYMDDRGKDNDGMNDDNFQFGVNGKNTHGTLYLDLSKFEFAKIKLPNLAIGLDLTELITDIIDGINLGDSSLIPGLDAMMQTDTYGLVADGNENSNNYLQVAITIDIIKELLKNFGVAVELPDVFDSLKADLTIDEIQGIKIGLGLNDEATGNKLDLNLGIEYIKLGKETTIELRHINFDTLFGNGVIDGVDSIVYRLLDDTDLQLTLNMNVPAGKYNLASILKLAGLDVNELIIEFTEDFNLDLTLNIQIQFDEVDKVDEKGNKVPGEKETVVSRAVIELISGSDNFIFKQGKVIGLYYFDDRGVNENGVSNVDDPNLGLESYKYNETTNKVEKTHGTLFADFSGVNIANIAIPPIKLDVDLTQLIQMIASSVAGSITGSGLSTASTLVNGFGMVADGVSETPNVDNYIKITVVTALINEILKMLNVDIGIELPEFSVELVADVAKGVSVSIIIDAENTLGEVKRIDASLAFPKLEIGVQKQFANPSGFIPDLYQTKFVDLVKSLLQYGEINAKINIGANASTINVQRLLNNILSASGLTLALPINVDLNDFANELDLKLQWEFDYNTPNNSKILLELRCDGTMTMSLYVVDGNVYVDMTGLGLPKFSLSKSRLVEKIVNLINGLLDGLLGGIMSEDGSTVALQQSVASANNMTVADMNTALFEAARDGEIEGENEQLGIMDYVQMLLGGLVVKDGVIQIGISPELMREVLKALSVNIAEDISIDVALDIFSGNLKLNAKFDELSLGADLTIVNIGKEQHVDIRVSASSYPELNASTDTMFVTSLFNALEPGLWIDLVSKNSSITENYFKYTKITMQKVPKEGMSLPSTHGGWANGDSILLTLLRLDGFADEGSDKKKKPTPALYIILDVNAKKIIIRGTTSLLPIDIGDALHADQMVNIGINFDIMGMLKGLIGPIITEINDTGVATTGIEDAFANLSVDSLLSGINVKIYGVKNIKVNVKLNHETINELMPNLINGLNGMYISLNPEKGNGFTVSGLTYNNVNGTAFLSSLWNNVILPVVQIAVQDEGLGGLWGIVRPVVNGIQDNVSDLVSRLLPFPQLVELNANVYIINGMLDNIQLIGYGADNKPKYQRERIELRIFNDMSQQVFFGTMDADHLNEAEFQAPYIYYDMATDSGLENMFTTTAYKPNKDKMYYEMDRDQDPAYLVDASEVTWAVTSYGVNDFDETIYDTPKAFTKSDMSAFKPTGIYTPGYYKAVGTTVIDGRSYTTTVRVVIENNRELIQATDTYVEDITVRAGNTLPNSITLRNDRLNKTLYLRNSNNSTKFTFIGGNQQQIGAHDVTASVQIKIVINGNTVNKPVKVHWDEASLVLVNSEPVHISIFNYKQFYNSVWTAQKALVETSDGRRIYQDIESTEIVSGYKELFDSDGNVTNLSDWTSATGFTTKVRIKLANAHTDQRPLDIDVIVDPRIVDYVRFDGLNSIVMNSIQTRADLPKSVRVWFKNGDNETYPISYNGWDGINENIFGNAGTYNNISFKFAQDYDGANFTANVVNGITITINKAEILYAKVGADNGVRECEISYEDFADRKFDDLDIRLITTDGKVIDYVDRYTYTTGWRHQETDEFRANNASTRSYLAGLSAEDLAKWVAVRETINNYEVVYRGATIGTGGERGAKVEVTLYNMTPSEYDEKPVNNSSKHVMVYMYFNVAEAIAREY